MGLDSTKSNTLLIWYLVILRKGISLFFLFNPLLINFCWTLHIIFEPFSILKYLTSLFYRIYMFTSLFYRIYMFCLSICGHSTYEFKFWNGQSNMVLHLSSPPIYFSYAISPFIKFHISFLIHFAHEIWDIELSHNANPWGLYAYDLPQPIIFNCQVGHSK